MDKTTGSCLFIISHKSFMSTPNKLDIYKELQQELEDRKKKVRYFSDDTITIEVDLANQWLYADWTGYQTEASVMKGCEKMLEAFRQYGLTLVLNDNTRVLGIWTPAAHWVGAVWLPQMKEAGLRRFAWIYSPSALSRFSTEESLRETPDPGIVRTFYGLNEGKNWLRSPEAG
ncbi:MAG TPA: hypothetical protein VHK69_21030 [Chitinophagaceae bacterium]|nr:hypothetical protein [Chitinophagaceae bacterium]